MNFFKAEPQLIAIYSWLNCRSKFALILLVLVVVVKVVHVAYILVHLVTLVHYTVLARFVTRNSILLAALLDVAVGLKSANKLFAFLPNVDLRLGLARVASFVVETILVKESWGLTDCFLNLLWWAKNLYPVNVYCSQERTIESGCVGLAAIRLWSCSYCA